MNLSEWQVEIAASPADSAQAACIDLALQSFFSLFAARPLVQPVVRLVPTNERTRRLLIVPSTSAEALRFVLQEILRVAYCRQASEDVKFGYTRVLFLRTQYGVSWHESLAQLCQRLGIAAIANASWFVPALSMLLEKPDGMQPLKRHDLRNAIEESVFPSGAAEIQEAYFRNPDLLHSAPRLLGLAQDTSGHAHDGTMPSVRLLCGAFAAGDITPDALRQAFDLIDKKRENSPPPAPEDVGAFIGALNKWILDVEEERRQLQLEFSACDKLASYLHGRKVLVIEDQLDTQFWSIALPFLFGLNKSLGCHEEIGGNGTEPHLYHADNIEDALARYGKTLPTFDIILLDLFSSQKRLRQATQAGGTMLSTIGQSLARLMETTRCQSAGAPSNEAPTPVPFPQVIVFSHESSGITARTVLQDFSAADYFFKNPGGGAHKSEFYASFRQCVINALKRTCIHVTGQSHVQLQQSHFHRWLAQFDPSDRPLVLGLMKHFRYYSAKGILNVFDGYLDGSAALSRDGRSVNISLEALGLDSSPADCLCFSYLGRATKSGPATLSLLSKLSWLKNVSEAAQKAVAILKAAGTESHISDLMPSFKSYDDLVSFCANPDRKGRPQCVVFVDDVIGSGGQVHSYLWKWVNRDIVKELCTPAHRAKPDAAKDEFSQGWRDFVGWLQGAGSGKIKDECPRIHAIFAAGNKNNDLKDFLKIGDWPAAGVMTSKIWIPICAAAPRHVTAEDCDCEEKFPVEVHVVDLRERFDQLCREARLPLDAIEALLQKHTMITNPRAKEYPCNFEPHGWKDCGALCATYANAPGNTLPIVWADGGRTSWIPLFSRYFNPWDDGGKEKLERACEGRPSDCVLKPPSGCGRFSEM